MIYRDEPLDQRAWEEWQDWHSLDRYDDDLSEGLIAPPDGPVVVGPGGFPEPADYDQWLWSAAADEAFGQWLHATEPDGEPVRDEPINYGRNV